MSGWYRFDVAIQEGVPEAEPDIARIRHALAEGDYAAFRQATYVYEESVRKRVGRWIERYPDFEARLGAAFTLEDLVEEVFLNALEHFDRWPENW